MPNEITNSDRANNHGHFFGAINDNLADNTGIPLLNFETDVDWQIIILNKTMINRIEITFNNIMYLWEYVSLLRLV